MLDRPGRGVGNEGSGPYSMVSVKCSQSTGSTVPPAGLVGSERLLRQQQLSFQVEKVRSLCQRAWQEGCRGSLWSEQELGTVTEQDLDLRLSGNLEPGSLANLVNVILRYEKEVPSSWPVTRRSLLDWLYSRYQETELKNALRDEKGQRKTGKSVFRLYAGAFKWWFTMMGLVDLTTMEPEVRILAGRAETDFAEAVQRAPEYSVEEQILLEEFVIDSQRAVCDRWMACLLLMCVCTQLCVT